MVAKRKNSKENADMKTPLTAQKVVSEWNDQNETFGTNEVKTMFRSGDSILSGNQIPQTLSESFVRAGPFKNYLSAQL